MRPVLLGLAAGIAALSAPATASPPDAPSGDALAFRPAHATVPLFTRLPEVRVHRRGHPGRDGDGRRDRDRRRDRGGDTFFAYRDYQGDSLWRADSFNDWWHDRPHRAYPAWMARNDKCERQYWSGGDWRC